MKRLILTLLFSIVCICAYTQTYDVNLNYTVKKGYAGWKSGEKVHVKRIEHISQTPSNFFELGQNTTVQEIYTLIDSNNTRHEVKSRFEGAMDCQYKTIDDLWNDYIIGNVLVMLQKKGTQIDLRDEMEEDAIEFIRRMKAYNQEFNDPYLENYIYSLVAKIAPSTLIDGRPGNVNILILEDAAQNAFTFANGTIVLTTGLISCLHSEDELVGVLAHEIAHFVMDHSVQNVNAAIKRQKRAEFWAGLATVATAVAEGVAAANNEYYVPGNATRAMLEMSFEISANVVNRLGMFYNHEQEKEADELAVKALELLGYDRNALSTALNRLALKLQEERDPSIYFAAYTHPSLTERIISLGTPYEQGNSEFEKKISFAITNTAIRKYNAKRFKQVLPLVEQNIRNAVATADDYILMADCLLALKNDDTTNRVAEEALKRAKSQEPTNLNLYKSEIIVALRQNKKTEALTGLNEYVKMLTSVREEADTYKSQRVWESTIQYVEEETNWANRMIIKVKNM